MTSEVSSALKPPPPAPQGIAAHSAVVVVHNGGSEDLASETSSSVADPWDLSLFPWYHGPTTRIGAELSLVNDGDFLVRDCISSPGDYVLTCKWKGQVLHFRMNRLIYPHPSDPSLPPLEQFQFEGDAFASVPEMILFYQERQQAISSLSGALIQNPIPREASLPLGGCSSSASVVSEEPQSTVSERSSGISEPPSIPPPPPPANIAVTPDKKTYFFGEAPAPPGPTPLPPPAPRTACPPPPPPPPPRALTSSYAKKQSSSTLGLQSLPVEDAFNATNEISVCNSLPRPTKPAGGVRVLPAPASQEALESASKQIKQAPLAKEEDDTIVVFPQDLDVSAMKELSSPSAQPEPPKSAPNSSSSAASTPQNHSFSSPAKGRSKSGSKSPTYDIPKHPAKSCLSEKQLQFNGLYDQPRQLVQRRAHKSGFPPPVLLPPPPPPTSPAHVQQQQQQPAQIILKNLPVRPPPPNNNTSASNSNPVIHPQEDLTSCSNTDTSYLEHRELTPLLSSDNDSMVFDTSSLPGDPFPSGLPLHGADSTNGNGLGAAAASETSSSSADSSPSSYSSSLVSSASHVSQSDADGGRATPTNHLNGSFVGAANAKTVSSFSNDVFQTVVFPEDVNKPLEPLAMARVHRILLDTPAEVLAINCSKLDADLLSLRLDRSYPGLPEELHSGLHLLTLVDGKGLREDLLERSQCLRAFLLVTVFTASNWRQSVAILSKWIRVTDCFWREIGNLYGFHALASALEDPNLRGLESLWSALDSEEECLAQRCKEDMAEALRSINKLQRPPANYKPCSKILIPHVLPFISGCKDLRHRRSFRQVYRGIFGERAGHVSELECPLFHAHLAQMQDHLLAIPEYKSRADSVFSTTPSLAYPEPLVADMFRTEFHRRLLWGSTSATKPVEERLGQLEKVITAMASICKDIEKNMKFKR